VRRVRRGEPPAARARVRARPPKVPPKALAEERRGAVPEEARSRRRAVLNPAEAVPIAPQNRVSPGRAQVAAKAPPSRPPRRAADVEGVIRVCVSDSRPSVAA
jgi:hypothetical protein